MKTLKIIFKLMLILIFISNSIEKLYSQSTENNSFKFFVLPVISGWAPIDISEISDLKIEYIGKYNKIGYYSAHIEGWSKEQFKGISEIFEFSIKYGGSLIYKPNNSIMCEFGISYSPLNVNTFFIKKAGRNIVGTEDNEATINESTGGALHTIIGIRVIMSSESNIITFFKAGFGYYSRNDVEATVDITGENGTFKGTISLAGESGMSIHAGFGLIFPIGRDFGLNLELNGHYVSLDKLPALWIEPSLGFGILF